jgi:hypothetical protein
MAWRRHRSSNNAAILCAIPAYVKKGVRTSGLQNTAELLAGVAAFGA